MKDDVKKELEKIRKKNGGILVAEKVIEAAQKPDSPLHNSFEWDDGIAAHKHRIHQAETLIRSFTITIQAVKKETRSFTVTSFQEYASHPSLKRGYGRTIDLLNGPEKQSLLIQEHNRCYGHVQHYMEFLEAAEMPKAASELEKAMSKVQSMIDGISGLAAGC